MSTATVIAARKARGAHYTPPMLARFVARAMRRTNLPEAPRVLDPACGDGGLLTAFHAEFPGARITGYDLDETALQTAAARVSGDFAPRDFLDIALEHRDELFTPEKFDAVIANPPYVRTQVLGAGRAQRIAQSFELDGRIDLYFAFLEGIAEVLKPGGIAGVIVSNRFMTTRSGATVRARIRERFDVLHVWDLGDTKLFEAAVLPAVLLLRKKSARHDTSEARFSSIYTTDRSGGERVAPDALTALEQTGLVRVDDRVFKVVHGKLDATDVWRVATESSDAWLETVRARTFCTFGDIGKIRVGVKTTADKVFVRREWPQPRPELLRPLLTHETVRRYRPLPVDREILYTHEERDGKKVAVDLDRYPAARAFLEQHRETLSARRYVIEAGRQWFEIWVPQQPALWARPKIVFPDISEQPVFAMSLGGEIVQGDCYWLAAESPDQIDLLWLALAVANSRFIEEFYDHAFHNKLYSGRRRFLTQYVEKFPLPDPHTALACGIVATAKRIYEMMPNPAADALADELQHRVAEAFGVPVTKNPAAEESGASC